MADGSKTAEGAPVRVVYCGGCNPHIDRTGVAAELAVGDPEVRPGSVVHLSGCPRACASGHALVVTQDRGGAQAPRDCPAAVVVAGELVDGIPTPAADIAAAVLRKLKE